MTSTEQVQVGKINITELTEENPHHEGWDGPPTTEPPPPPPDRDGRRLPDKPGRLPLWQQLTLIAALVLLEAVAVIAIARLGNLIRDGLLRRQEGD